MRALRSYDEIDRYITAIHESAHLFVAHRSEFFELKDPAVTFPGAGTGHLARANFRPKVKQPGMEPKHARELIEIGYAGLHGQNLLERQMLLRVLASTDSRCEDDFERVERLAAQTSITSELGTLFQQSRDLVSNNAETIHALADVIYMATGDVLLSDVLSVLGPATPPAQSTACAGQAIASKGIFAQVKLFFGRT